MKSYLLLAWCFMWSCVCGCELSPGESSGPVQVCERAGQQCRYAPGKLGVCQFDEARTLGCMSQH